MGARARFYPVDAWECTNVRAQSGLEQQGNENKFMKESCVERGDEKAGPDPVFAMFAHTI